jgi:hypothetical protein
MRFHVKSIVNFASLTLAIGLYLPAIAQNPNPSDVFDLSKVNFQIVDATFVTKLDSQKAQFAETKPDQYHGLIVTLRIAKTAGEELTLTCQDIALHYRYGQQSDIARCYGLSSYTTRQDEDRSMALYSQGWGTSTTGLATTKSGTVYIDVFFQNMESNTSDLYLFIAQPTGAHFTSRGWKKN